MKYKYYVWRGLDENPKSYDLYRSTDGENFDYLSPMENIFAAGAFSSQRCIETNSVYEIYDHRKHKLRADNVEQIIFMIKKDEFYSEVLSE